MLDSKEHGSSASSRTSGSEDRERLLTDLEVSQEDRKPAKTLSWLGIATLLAASSCCAALVGAWVGSHWPVDSDASCTSRITRYSPIVDEVGISYDTIRFNGSLLKENVFRKGAGPEVDAAWASLGVDYRSVIISTDKAARSGLLPDQVKVSEKYGGGFPANVEGLHQLHCLNLVRQALYYNYDYYHSRGQGAFLNKDHIVRYHVSHCLDIIRQQLMCTVDVGVLGQVWFQPEGAKLPEAYVDFNTRHKCRNFDAVRQWAEEHQIAKNIANDFLQPPAEGDTVYDAIP